MLLSTPMQGEAGLSSRGSLWTRSPVLSTWKGKRVEHPQSVGIMVTWFTEVVESQSLTLKPEFSLGSSIEF